MKLTELATPKKSRQVTQVFESYFGTKMPVNKLTVREAQAMLKRVRGVIAEHQRGTGRHTSERNPAYLKLVMMEQALTSRIREEQVPEERRRNRLDVRCRKWPRAGRSRSARGGSGVAFSQRASLGNPHYRIQYDWRASGRGARQSLLRDRAHRTRRGAAARVGIAIVCGRCERSVGHGCR